MLAFPDIVSAAFFCLEVGARIKVEHKQTSGPVGATAVDVRISMLLHNCCVRALGAWAFDE